MNSVNQDSLAIFPPNIVKIKEYKAKKVPASVIGTPVYTPSKSEMLYLASLKAPAIGNSTKITYPNIGRLISWNNKNATKAGATPKDTKSANESSSLPISESTFKNLAILPSYLSMSPAKRINKQAILYS